MLQSASPFLTHCPFSTFTELTLPPCLETSVAVLLAEAFAKVTEDAAAEAQKEQQEELSAEAMMAPAAMAAMAGPGAADAIPGASQTQESLGNMLNTLRKGSRDPNSGRRMV